MSIESIKQKLQLLGNEILEENEYAIAYRNNETNIKQLILENSQGRIKVIKDEFKRQELGKHIVVLGDRNALGIGIYVKDNFENLLGETGPVKISVDKDVLSYERPLNKSNHKVVIVNPTGDKPFTYKLINYQGKVIEFVVAMSGMERVFGMDEMIVRINGDNIEVYEDYGLRKRVLQTNIAFDTFKIESADFFDTIVQIKPEHRLLYTRRVDKGGERNK